MVVYAHLVKVRGGSSGSWSVCVGGGAVLGVRTTPKPFLGDPQNG